MDKITTVGVDLAKQVMAVHAVGADGQMVMAWYAPKRERLGAARGGRVSV